MCMLCVCYVCIRHTLVEVADNYEFTVLSMSVMGFQQKF